MRFLLKWVVVKTQFGLFKLKNLKKHFQTSIFTFATSTTYIFASIFCNFITFTVVLLLIWLRRKKLCEAVPLRLRL